MDDSGIERTINGFGGRLNEVEKKHERCKGETTMRLSNIESAHAKMDSQIAEIYNVQKDMAVSMSDIKATMKTWGLTIALLSPIIAAIIGAVVSKIL